MKVLPVFLLFATSTGLFVGSAEAFSPFITKRGHPSIRTVTTSSKLYKRGACVGKHPCERDESPSPSPRKARGRSSDTSRGPSTRAPLSTSSPRPPPQALPLPSDALQRVPFSSPGSIASSGSYLTPPSRSPIRRYEVLGRSYLGSEPSTRHLLLSTPSPSPSIGSPVRLEQVNGRTQPENSPSRSLNQALLLRMNQFSSPNRNRNTEGDSNASISHSDTITNDSSPNKQSKVHRTLARHYSNASRNIGVQDSAKRARWDQLHKAHKTESEYYSQVSRVMDSSPDLLSTT